MTSSQEIRSICGARELRWGELSAAERSAVLKRPAMHVAHETLVKVREIVAAVRKDGDKALKAYALKFDGWQGESFVVPEADWELAWTQIGEEARVALLAAAQNIGRFHAAQKPQDIEVEVAPGIRCQRQWRALERVGLYVPAGTAPLLSTVLMLGIPACLAGVQDRVLITPAGADGRVDIGILAAAKVAGVTRVYAVGGAHGIAALAYGTETIPKVDKIFGPGSAFVTQAKQLVALDPEGAAADLPAGPSEVMVVADGSADPRLVAADLLSQAEHGPDSQVILVTTDADLMTRTADQVLHQLAALPRKDIAHHALLHSVFIVVEDLSEAMTVVNTYAPEHLILQVKDAASYGSKVQHAGSVFLGPWTPESAGDYASGTNHVLPTYGLARTFSGLGLESFMKSITFQEISKQGLEKLGDTVMTLARLEGLEAHAQAVAVRLTGKLHPVAVKE